MSETSSYDLDRDNSAKRAKSSKIPHAPSDVQRRTATRADLLEGVAATCPSLPRNETREVFEMALAEVSLALVRGEAVKLRSFGLFAVREKRERVGRNPRTGVEVPITPRRVLTFKASPVLLDLVNGGSVDEADASGAPMNKKQ